MNNLVKFAMIAATTVSPPAFAQKDFCAAIDGAIVLNNDNEFIGSISSSFDSNSIFHEFGTYGNEYSSKSIWNEYGENGNEYGSNTAFNEYSSNPPRIIKDRTVIGYLTVNKYKKGAINPIMLDAMCYDFKPPR